MEENPDATLEQDIVCDEDTDNNYDPSDCKCELCYYSREICEYIQDQTDRDAEDVEHEVQHEES